MSSISYNAIHDGIWESKAEYLAPVKNEGKWSNRKGTCSLLYQSAVVIHCIWQVEIRRTQTLELVDRDMIARFSGDYEESEGHVGEGSEIWSQGKSRESRNNIIALVGIAARNSC